jgi:Lar family restriction alleviation protein
VGRADEVKEVRNMAKETILSCPFCGATEVEVCRTNENACWIRCADCGADAESAKSREKAIEIWNKRFETCEATIVDDGDKEYWETNKRIVAREGK